MEKILNYLFGKREKENFALPPITKAVNGIFDEWNIPDNYASIKMKRTIATINKIDVKTKEVRSTAAFTNNTKQHVGLKITLTNDRGNAVVFIPQTELPDLEGMINSTVEVEKRTWSSRMEGTSVESKLKFLDGKLAGNIYEGVEFA